MSASIIYAGSSRVSVAPPPSRAIPEAVRDAATADDLVGTRLRDLDQRISAADRIATPATDLQDIAGAGPGRRAPAANPSDNIDNLATRVAQLAEADDRAARLSADAIASVAAPFGARNGGTLTEKPEGGRQTPRLADLIKLKRAEIERYEAEASIWDGVQAANRLSQPLRHDGGHDPFSHPAPRPVAALHLDGAAHATSPLMPPNGYLPAMEPAAATPAGIHGGFVPPTPPPAEPPRERTSAAIGARMTELREEGFSSSLYGFGAGLGIALMSGAALYVVLRLV